MKVREKMENTHVYSGAWKRLLIQADPHNICGFVLTILFDCCTSDLHDSRPLSAVVVEGLHPRCIEAGLTAAPLPSANIQAETCRK